MTIETEAGRRVGRVERLVRAVPATVYHAPTARRRYLTKKAAIRAEARALIARKYPTEKEEHDDMGRCTYEGFHWTSRPRADELYRRVCRMVERHSSNAGLNRPDGRAADSGSALKPLLGEVK